jgi:hypothetical protein
VEQCQAPTYVDLTYNEIGDAGRQLLMLLVRRKTGLRIQADRHGPSNGQSSNRAPMFGVSQTLILYTYTAKGVDNPFGFAPTGRIQALNGISEFRRRFR